MHFRRMLLWLRPKVWNGWPDKIYQDKSYQQRLEAVQGQIKKFLDTAPAGPFRILNICAGDGRDVLGAVCEHPRRTDVFAWFVELDRDSVEQGRQTAVKLGLENSTRFINGDATVYSTYRSVGRADLVIACGVWGHVPTPEKPSLVRAMATFCNPGGRLIWTRGVSRGIEKVRELEALFDEQTWDDHQLTFTPNKSWAVAIYRYCGPMLELPADGQIFNFQRNAGLVKSTGKRLRLMRNAAASTSFLAFCSTAEELCPTAFLMAGRNLWQAMEAGIV
jgi:hypothetical protein